MPRAWAGLLLLCVLTAGCSAAAAVRPSAYPDSDVPCPGALKQWNLRVLDRRAETTSSDKVIAKVRDAIRQSFPGCQWTSDEGVPSIDIEIHNFESVKNGDVWDAHVQWNVTAASPTGAVLLGFEADETVSRPNYMGSDNEKESLTEAYRAAVERTAKGLRTVRMSDAARPPRGTSDPSRGQSLPALASR